MTLTVHIPPHLIAKFRRWAKQHWPNEVLVGLLGESLPNSLQVSDLEGPIVGNEEMVKDYQWEDDSQVVGTVHTHTFTEPWETVPVAPSQQDLRDAAEHKERIFGICNVWKDREGKMRTSLMWFAGGPKLRIKA